MTRVLDLLRQIGDDPAHTTHLVEVFLERELMQLEGAHIHLLGDVQEFKRGKQKISGHLLMHWILRDSEREPFCFVVDESEGELQAERRPLVLGEIAQDRVVVTAGLTPGETVVVRGQHFVHAGDPLNVVTILED